jgi:hypothetical protein
METAVLKMKPVLNLQDDSYSPELAKDYILSVEIGADSCSYAVLDSTTNRYLAIQAFPFESIDNFVQLEEKFTQLYRSSSLLQGSYKASSVSIINPKFTLIPSDYFNRDEAEALLSFNHKLADEQAIYDFVNAGGMYNVFGISTPLKDSLRTLMPSARILHHTTVLLESLLVQNPVEEAKKKQVFISVRKAHFEIMVTDGKNLLFLNSFASQSSEDILYFVLAVIEQLQLPVKTTPVTLIGEVENRSALHEILQKYIPGLSMGIGNYDFTHNFGSELPESFYYGLLNQYKCVL